MILSLSPSPFAAVGWSPFPFPVSTPIPPIDYLKQCKTCEMWRGGGGWIWMIMIALLLVCEIFYILVLLVYSIYNSIKKNNAPWIRMVDYVVRSRMEYWFVLLLGRERKHGNGEGGIERIKTRKRTRSDNRSRDTLSYYIHYSFLWDVGANLEEPGFAWCGKTYQRSLRFPPILARGYLLFYFVLSSVCQIRKLADYYTNFSSEMLIMLEIWACKSTRF